jgi:hypothetical protein
MNDNQKAILDDLTSILNKIKSNKVYGSVEIFFEDGEITQITQRIINKVKKNNVKTPPSASHLTHHKNQNDNASIHLSTLE